MPTLLVFDEQREVRDAYHRAFSEAGYAVFGVDSLAAADKVLAAHRMDLVLVDSGAAGAAAWLSRHCSPKGGPAPRAFVISRLPYDDAAQALARLPFVKLITMPLALADIVNAVRLDLSANEPTLRYGEGMFELIRTATEQVLTHYLAANVVVEPAIIKRGDRETSGSIAVIPLSGPKFLGTIALCFDRAFSLAVARGMVGDTEGTMELSEHDILEAVSETSNQVCGMLQEQLLQRGYKASIGLPRSISGDKLRFIHPGRNQVGQIKVSLRRVGLLQRFQAILGAGTTIEFCFDEVS